MKKVVSLMGLALVVLSTMTGCLQTMKTKPLADGVRAVEWRDDAGRLLRSYTEILDASGEWYEAEQVGGRWRLSPAGMLKKKQTESGGSSGGGGGSC